MAEIEQKPQEAQATAPIAPTTTNDDFPGKTLAIVGLVLALFMPLIGLVLCIVAYFQSKKAGFKNTIAVAGIIVNAIINLIIIGTIAMMVAFGFWIFGAVSKANDRDNSRKATMQYLGLELERYVQDNQVFPVDLQDLSSLSGFNATNLADPDGNNFSYEPTPAGCDVATNCTGYRIYIPAEVVKNGQEILQYTNNLRL